MIPRLAPLAAALALSALAASPAPAADVSGRAYGLRFLDGRVAELLVWEICAKSQGERCEVKGSGRQTLELYADAETHAAVVRLLAEKDILPAAQSFQILLLAAGREAAATQGEIPENARQALAEVGEFLPFKSFRVLDLGWIRATERATVALAGPGGRAYEVHFRFRYAGDADGRQIHVERFDLLERHAPPPPGPAGEADEKEAAAEAGRPVRVALSTAFGMEVGETVVVGTARSGGDDEVLVALLSAVK